MQDCEQSQGAKEAKGADGGHGAIWLPVSHWMSETVAVKNGRWMRNVVGMHVPLLLAVGEGVGALAEHQTTEGRPP